MKTKQLLAAATAAVAFAACSDYDPGMSDKVVDYTDEQLAIMDEYTTNFVTRFGAIDPDHTWGFGELGVVEEGAKTRAVDPNSNQWLTVTKGKLTEGGADVPIKIEINSSLGVDVVPGFPIQNKLSDHNGEYAVKFDQNETNPTYFNSVEELLEHMRKIGKDSVYPAGDIDEPENENGKEVDAVLAVFSEKGEESYTSTIDFTNFFVQQVWRGNNTYTDGAGNTVENASDKMNYLVCGEKDHTYNFNSSTGTIQFMYKSSTDKFGFSSAENGGTIYYTYRVEEIEGNYYVGFDFTAEGDKGTNQFVQRDYIYDDWIVKIVPGNGTTTTNTARVMCEDLGNTYDIDFNDLVFDVYFTGVKNSGNYTAHITIQAVGGTLPIYIANQEAHGLLGAATNQPVNVGATNGVTKAPYSFEIPGMATTNPDDIDITVSALSASKTTSTLLPKANNIPNGAPTKICVPTSTKWTKESQQMDRAYPDFFQWVQDEDGKAGFNSENPWTTNGITDYLYN